MPVSSGPKWFASDEERPLSWLRQACEQHRDAILDELTPLLSPHAGGTASSELAITGDKFWSELMAALAGDESAFALRLAKYGSHSACAGTDLRSLSDAIETIRTQVVRMLIQSYADNPVRLEGALCVCLRVFDRALHAITREYLAYREALMEEQRRHEQIEHRRLLALEAENQRIQAASQMKSQFLANMSHELRTPLNSIIGFADLLYDEEVDPGSQQHREFLSDILKSSRHLLKLINDVLDLAKVEAGKLEFSPEETDLSVLLHEIADVLQSQANRRCLKLVLDVQAGVQTVFVDPARLRQVLFNYLSNALKFSPEGGTVTVRACVTDDERFAIEVRDMGVGIAEHDLGRLFQEFQQLPSVDGVTRAGTGLGLALTKRIVESQGGEVGVQSALGEGSTFWLRLPLEAPEREARPASYCQELRPGAARTSQRRGRPS